MVQLQVEAEAAGGGVQHAQPLGRGFLADAVAGDDGDAVASVPWCSSDAGVLLAGTMAQSCGPAQPGAHAAAP